MLLVRLNWRPGKRELRQFGAMFLTGFVLIGTIRYFWPWEWLIARDERLGILLISIGISVGLVALTGHKIALPLYWAWLGIAYVLGNVMSRLIIAAIYFLVVTPLGILSRYLDRDKLRLAKPDAESYWQKISLPNEIKLYERQF
jgi:hypothetical protein